MPYGKSNKQIADSHMKKTSGFKMSGWSAFTKTDKKADPNVKKNLLEQLSNMKDPMNSNRGKSISNKLMKDFGMSADELDSYA